MTVVTKEVTAKEIFLRIDLISSTLSLSIKFSLLL